MALDCARARAAGTPRRGWWPPSEYQGKSGGYPLQLAVCSICRDAPCLRTSRRWIVGLGRRGYAPLRAGECLALVGSIVTVRHGPCCWLAQDVRASPMNHGAHALGIPDSAFAAASWGAALVVGAIKVCPTQNRCLR